MKPHGLSLSVTLRFLGNKGDEHLQTDSVKSIKH